MHWLAAVSLVVAVVSATPSSASDRPAGQSCGAVAESTLGDLRSYGAILYGGPVADSGTLRCSIQTLPSHYEADMVSEVAVNAGAVVLNPRQRHLTKPDASADMYLCTEWTVADGAVRYWNSATLAWTNDAAAPCALMLPADDSDAGPPLDAALGASRDNADPTVCALLPVVLDGTVADSITVTPEGELYVLGTRLQECYPYDEPPRQRIVPYMGVAAAPPVPTS